MGIGSTLRKGMAMATEVLGKRAQQAVLMIGLPEAGKTVYLNVMIDRLRRLFNAYDNTGRYAVKCLDDETEGRIGNVIAYLKNRKWPKRTWQAITSGSEISQIKIAYVNNKNKYVEKELICQDYGGEVLESATGESSAESAAPKEAVESLNASIETASNIMLVMDSTMLGEKSGDKKFDRILRRLLTQIENAGKTSKIALIFTKGDMLDNETRNDVEKLFEEHYPSAYSSFRSMGVQFKIFLVAAVKCPDLRTPPKDFDSAKHSEGLIEPIEWLLDIQVPVD
jgi:GTPase SAR1 family protein